MARPLVADSLPYPWPWHGAFEPRRAALLVFRDGMASPPSRETSALLFSLIDRAAGLGIMIGELPSGGGPVAVPEYQVDLRMERPHLGGFSGTDLDVVLRKHRITDLLFAGFPFELGADCTMRQANDLGYECLAITDCCSGLAADTLAGAISSIQMSGGIFGAVANSEALFELFASAHESAARAASGA